MMKPKTIVFAILAAGVLLCAWIWGPYYYEYAKIGAAYNAKTVCSCVFVAGRPLDSIMAEELYAVPFGREKVDRAHRVVTASLLGLVARKAIYRPGLGCTLLPPGTTTLPAPAGRQPTDSPPAAVPLPDSTLSPSQQAALARILDGAFAEPNPGQPQRTRAVVVLHRGKVVAERYAPGFTAQTPLLGWSMTKSVTNALIGLLVQDGKLNLDAPAPLQEWQKDARRNITLRQLLQMTSGLAFEEDYGKVSDATKMLFTAPNAGAVALASPLAHEPGQVWYYSSGTTNILQTIIRRQFPDLATYQAFPYQRLFQKIGMSSALMEPDPAGNFIGSSFMYATARDWARFGQLYLQDGVWGGERLLPPGWVEFSSTPTAASAGDYAAQFWTTLRQEGLPADTFMADGFEGQFVVIIPSRQLVLVRLGCTPDPAFFAPGPFFKKIVAALNE